MKKITSCAFHQGSGRSADHQERVGKLQTLCKRMDFQSHHARKKRKQVVIEGIHQSNTDDVILSLRERIADSLGQVYYKVHLTFILTYGGYLTEMKARFNEKPGEEYHNYIIPLLEHPIVQGIAEGFYATENDFKFTDLPKDEIVGLVTMKPGLWNVTDDEYDHDVLPPQIRDDIDKANETKIENIIIDTLEQNGLDETGNDGRIAFVQDNLSDMASPRTILQRLLSGDEYYFSDVAGDIEEYMVEETERCLDGMSKADVIEMVLKPAAEKYQYFVDETKTDSIEELVRKYNDDMIDNGTIANALIFMAEHEDDIVTNTTMKIYDDVANSLFPIVVDDIKDVMPDIEHLHGELRRNVSPAAVVLEILEEKFDDEIRGIIRQDVNVAVTGMIKELK